MQTPGADKIAVKLSRHVFDWQQDRGELAEILKAEAEARILGIENSYATTITERRKDGERAALQYTKESIDYKARVDIHEQWIAFYTLLLNNNIIIDVSELP